MASEVLTQLQNQVITPKEAYKELNRETKPAKLHRAHFVKLRIHVPQDKTANRLLRLLFLLPIPLVFVRIALRFVKDKGEENQLPFSKQEIMDLISYRGIKVSVKSKGGEDIYIKTF